ncbi:MAG: hypothetical protein ABG776_14095 [Cyanobacteria bacterium J06555_13]
MKTTQKRLGLGLAAAVVVSGFAPLATQPAHAQRDRYDDSAYSYCDRRANDEARRQASGRVIGGAIEGAIGGAIIGGILGGRRGSRRASRAGAVIGGVSGGAEQQRARDEIYRREFDRCMDAEERYR